MIVMYAETYGELCMNCQLPDEHPDCCDKFEDRSECIHVMGHEDSAIKIKEWNYVEAITMIETLRSIRKGESLRDIEKSLEYRIKEIRDRRPTLKCHPK